MRPSEKDFWRSESAAAAVEFTIVSVVTLILLLGILDLARFAWEFNSQKAAARAGARFAAVHEPAVTQLINFDATAAPCSIGGGQKITSGMVHDFTCNSTGCTASAAPGGGSACLTSGTLDLDNFNAIVDYMQRYDPRIAAANVTVTYRERGLGVSGNPYGTDVSPLITVSLRDLTFTPIALRLLGITLTMPSAATTITAEDLS